jgi:hypothetical protein
MPHVACCNAANSAPWSALLHKSTRVFALIVLAICARCFIGGVLLVVPFLCVRSMECSKGKPLCGFVFGYFYDFVMGFFREA